MALAHAGHEVTCVCLSYQRKGASSETISGTYGGRVRWISVDLGAMGIPGFFKYFALARKTIQEVRPDVIWSCSDTIYTVLGNYLSRRLRCSSVADLYDNFEYFGSYKIPVLRSLYRKAVREADGVSCVSESLCRHVVTTYGRTKATSVITNAVDASVFRPMDKAQCREKLGLPQTAVLIGSAGDISNYRGADMMYRAMTELPGALGGAHLAVAGYRTADTRLPVGENVHDLGQLSPEDVPVFLNALDLAVVYNRSSSFGDFCFPQKFYEILVCHIPIIAANVGELSVLLQHKSHLLYEDGNITDFASACMRQLKNREVIDIDIPSWADQAELLQLLMQRIAGGN